MLSDSEILKSIRDRDSFTYDSYVDLLSYFVLNRSQLRDFNICEGLEIDEEEIDLENKIEFGEVDNEDLTVAKRELQKIKRRKEEERKIGMEREQRLNRFGEKFDYYFKLIQAMAEKLSEEQLKKAEKEVVKRFSKGMSVEDRV